MRQFNCSIQVTVEVDAIAQQLRGMFKEESAHADSVVEQIIGRAVHKDHALLGRMLTAMNGFTRHVIAEIGKTYPCKGIDVWGYWTPESIEKNDTVRKNIESVTVVDINEFADEPIQVSCMRPNKKGEMEEVRIWITADKLTV